MAETALTQEQLWRLLTWPAQQPATVERDLYDLDEGAEVGAGGGAGEGGNEVAIIAADGAASNNGVAAAKGTTATDALLGLLFTGDAACMLIGGRETGRAAAARVVGRCRLTPGRPRFDALTALGVSD
jgi:hypothetical protein